MSYMSDLRYAGNAAQLSSVTSPARPVASPSGPLGRANTRLSEALEAALLVATLSGVSLVLSTIAAGAF